MGRSISRPQFGEVFGLHHAMQLAVSTAFRSGSSICPETLANMLMSEYPDSGMAEAEIRVAILKAADAARVPIRRAREAPPPVVFCPPGKRGHDAAPRASAAGTEAQLPSKH